MCSMTSHSKMTIHTLLKTNNYQFVSIMIYVFILFHYTEVEISDTSGVRTQASLYIFNCILENVFYYDVYFCLP